MVFEPAVARAWLLSSLFSLVLEFFLTDPAKIAVLGVVKTRIEMEIGAYRDKKVRARSTRAPHACSRAVSCHTSERLPAHCVWWGACRWRW